MLEYRDCYYHYTVSMIRSIADAYFVAYNQGIAIYRKGVYKGQILGSLSIAEYLADFQRAMKYLNRWDWFVKWWRQRYLEQNLPYGVAKKVMDYLNGDRNERHT